MRVLMERIVGKIYRMRARNKEYISHVRTKYMIHFLTFYTFKSLFYSMIYT